MHSKENTAKKDQTENKPVKKKKSWADWLIGLVLVVGIGIMLYPTVSNWVNSFSASGVSASYNSSIEEMTEEERNRILEEARLYNERLQRKGSLPGQPADEQTEEYLNLFGGKDQTVIGTIEIPSIDVSLPIYKGTEEEALKNGIGHLIGSSVPIGGIGNHAVLSGHRGLPSMKLLSQLDQVAEDDLFIINTTGRTLTYQVDSIHVVEPDDLHFLAKDSQKDLVTLVTCTPYGVNSHRLLVTGHRVSNDLDPSKASPDGSLVDPVTVALWIGIPLAILLASILMKSGKRKKGEFDDEEMDDEDL